MQLNLVDSTLSEHDRLYKEALMESAEICNEKMKNANKNITGEDTHNGLESTKANMRKRRAKEKIDQNIFYEPCSMGGY